MDDQRRSFEERLAERARERELKRDASASTSDSKSRLERIEEFLSKFDLMKSDILTRLIERDRDADGAARKKSELVEFLNRNLHLLTDYTKGQCQLGLREIESSLKSIVSSQRPAFSFSKTRRNRRPRRPRKNPEPSAAAAETTEAKQSSPEASSLSQSQSQFDHTITELNGVTQVLTLPECDDPTLLLSSCRDSKLTLTKVLSSAYIRSLSQVVLRLAPIQRSVFVDDCSNCDFNLAARQIRFRNCVNCIVRIRSASGPIIENSRGILVTQYDIGVDGESEVVSEEDLRVSGLGGSEFVDFWDKVQDFDWQRTERSPNWTFLNEDEEKRE